MLNFCLLYMCCLLSTACSTCSSDKSCAISQERVDEEEYREVGKAKMEMLQRQPTQSSNTRALNNNSGVKGVDEEKGNFGWETHRFLLVRPCERFAGDGISGLPRHRVTGECCGDQICSESRWESTETCPQDCLQETSQESTQSTNSASAKRLLPPTQTHLFGELGGMEHEEYHCEGVYNLNDDPQQTCSMNPSRDSKWLQDLLDRAKNRTLAFDLPPAGSIAVEFGAGFGQDSRNIAKLAGYILTSIDVSPAAIEKARNFTSPDMLGTGPAQIEFVAYDAMALPVPKQRVDFIFDATVYCGLRHVYLARNYQVWSRLATPGHTLVNIQCWSEESNNYRAVPKTKRDMEADFEPIFDILHSESCFKNQGGVGWCFYMKLKPPEVRKSGAEQRLKLQQKARDGDIDYVRNDLQRRHVNASEDELMTLFYIAEANKHRHLMNYLASIMPPKEDQLFELLYGSAGDAASVAAEDRFDGSESRFAREEVAHLRADWELAEAELLLQNKLNQSQEMSSNLAKAMWRQRSK